MFKKLLFENLGVKQTVFKNTFWLLMGTAAKRLLNAVLVIYVARVLGAANYGKFTFALAFVSLFAIFSDFAIPSITTRELSKGMEREKEFPAILSLKIILSIGALILILAGSFFITPEHAIRKIMWILAPYILINNFSGIIYAFLKARQQMEYVFLIGILQALAVSACGFFVILNFPSLENLSYSYLFASLTVLILILFFFHLKFFPLKLSWNASTWKIYLAMSWPIGLAIIFGTCFRNIDSIMLGYFGFIPEVGWYNAAYRIIRLIILPAALISDSFFPILSKAFKESRETFQKSWNQHMELKIFFAVPLVIGGVALASRIISFIYNPNFAPSVFAFQILALGSGIILINGVLSQTLIVSNQQKKVLLGTFFGAITNIILNLILIPKFNLYGAALAALATFLLNLFLLFKFSSKFTSIKLLNPEVLFSFIIAIFSGIIMYFVISFPPVYRLNILLLLLIGAVTYSVCYLMLKMGSRKGKMGSELFFSETKIM